MTHTIEDISPTRKAVSITIPAETLAGYQKEIAKGFAAKVRLPGFRPGKAPADIIKRQYGKDLADELRVKVQTEAIRYLSEKAELQIYGVFGFEGFDGTEIPADSAVVKLDVELFPSFETPEYKGLEIPVETATVADDEVDKAVETLRSSQGRFDVVDRPAAKGDYVKLSYVGTHDGAPIKSIAGVAAIYGEQANTWEEAGADDAPGVPAIVNGIIGKKAGDKAEFINEFPAGDDFPHEALRGKKGTYAVEVFEVRARILPELDEAFFKNAKAADLADLKAQLRAQLLQRKQREAEYDARKKAVEILGEKSPAFDLPESAIEQAVRDLFLENANYEIRRGADIKDIEATRDAVLEKSREPARQRVRAEFILDKIAETEKLEVNNQELSQAIAHAAYTTGAESVEKFAREYTQDRSRLLALRRQILREKALNVVIENAKKTPDAAAAAPTAAVPAA